MTATLTTDELVGDVVDVLDNLYERDGKLTAEQVVAEAAASPGSPLYQRFQWDDKVAAHEYRLEQARSLIRTYTLKVEDRKVRRFVFIPSTDSYQPFERVVENKDWRAEMLSDFRRDADRFTARWRAHSVVAEEYRRWLHEQLAEVV